MYSLRKSKKFVLKREGTNRSKPLYLLIRQSTLIKGEEKSQEKVRSRQVLLDVGISNMKG